jgi:hypothetical protein
MERQHSMQIKVVKEAALLMAKKQKREQGRDWVPQSSLG